MAALDSAAALPPFEDRSSALNGSGGGGSSSLAAGGAGDSDVGHLSSLMESTHIPQVSPPSAPLKSPFSTKQTAVAINGIHTDVVVQAFTDRIFVTITQLNKIGSLLYATSEDDSSGGKSFDVQVLMGRRDDPLLVLYARQLIEQFSSTTDRPLLLAVSLKEEGRGSETFQALINVCLKLRCW